MSYLDNARQKQIREIIKDRNVQQVAEYMRDNKIFSIEAIEIFAVMALVREKERDQYKEQWENAEDANMKLLAKLEALKK